MLYIADTCDVTMRRTSDQDTIFTAEAQLASLNQAIESEDIKGGIGSKTQYVIKSDKTVELSVRNATFDPKWLEIQQGVSFKEGTITVTRKEESLKVDAGSVTIEGTPVDDIVHVRGLDGSLVETIAEVDELGASTTVTVENAKDGDLVTVIYKEEVQGEILNIDSDKFPENYEVEYHTIAYDTVTNKVVADIYIIFYNASPTGDMELSFENGSALTPETSFQCLSAPNSNNIGSIAKVPRASK